MILHLLFLPFLSVFLFESQILFLFSAIPLMVAYFRFGMAWGSLVFVSAIAIHFLLGQALELWLFIVCGPFTAVSFFIFCKRNWRIEKTFLATLLSLVTGYAGAVTVLSHGHPYQYLHEKGVIFLQSLPQKFEAITIAGFQAEEWKTYLSHLAEIASPTMHTFLQEQFLGYALSALILMLWMSTLILGFAGISPLHQKLTKWKLKDEWVWIFIGVFFFSLVPVQYITPFSKNVFHVFLVLYFLQGVAIAAHTLTTRKFSKFGRFLTYTLLFSFPLLCVSVGFFDMWADFRSKMNNHKKNKKGDLR
ncbi:MAG: hypothetical protein A3B70_05465 [Deltaproteobacteria bacterium RIFCSPHIGHO2_02_FULL_40_11]|nr:MAG: hypothetical protein A3B70_05465 [Deltaproteobacteria bacterium RIFCSPHIGHO2_02_FULL_40_11]